MVHHHLDYQQLTFYSITGQVLTQRYMIAGEYILNLVVSICILTLFILAATVSDELQHNPEELFLGIYYQNSRIKCSSMINRIRVKLFRNILDRKLSGVTYIIFISGHQEISKIQY